MKTVAFTAALALALPVGFAAMAHESATGVVKERMERMERFEELIDRIFAMMHGELSYDPRAVRNAAEEIAQGAGPHLTDLFPQGIGGAPSEAADDIWRDFGTFAHFAEMLEGWSREVAAQARTPARGSLPKRWEDARMGPGMMRCGGMMSGSGSVAAAWHVAATCNACHAAFRDQG